MNGFFVWLPFIVNAFMKSVIGGERQLTICQMIRNSANSTVVHEVSVCILLYFYNDMSYSHKLGMCERMLSQYEAIHIKVITFWML